MWQPLCQWDCQKWFAKIKPCNSRCAIGCVKNSLSKEVSVKVAMPLRFEMQRLPTKATWHTLCHWVCQKSLSKEGYVIVAVPLGFGMLRISKKTLYGTRCAIGIRGKLVCKIIKYLSVRNVVAKFGYLSVFCWLPLCHWDCHTMMWLPAVWCNFPLSRSYIGWCDFPPRDVT